MEKRNGCYMIPTEEMRCKREENEENQIDKSPKLCYNEYTFELASFSIMARVGHGEALRNRIFRTP